MPSWYLEDADLIAAQNPYTFFKSSRQTIAKVRPGEVVKLIFAFQSDDPKAPQAERMWVLVDSFDSDGTFKGRLDNDPYWIQDIKYGDPITFDVSHIINTEHDGQDENNLIARFTRRCFVTHRVLIDGQKVRYLYREAPDDEQDSGWRLTANDESEEYMNDSKKISYVPLGKVLSKDDSFIHLLDSPQGSSFVWDASHQCFIELDAEEFPQS